MQSLLPVSACSMPCLHGYVPGGRRGEPIPLAEPQLALSDDTLSKSFYWYWSSTSSLRSKSSSRLTSAVSSLLAREEGQTGLSMAQSPEKASTSTDAPAARRRCAVMTGRGAAARWRQARNGAPAHAGRREVQELRARGAGKGSAHKGSHWFGST